MYIDADFIIKAASLLSALGALVAAVVAVYKADLDLLRTAGRSARACGAGVQRAMQGCTGEVGQAPEQKRPPAYPGGLRWPGGG